MEKVSGGNMYKDRNELSETITIKECRTLRAVMNDLTAAPVLTRQEYLRFMVEIGHVMKRLDQ